MNHLIHPKYHENPNAYAEESFSLFLSFPADTLLNRYETGDYIRDAVSHCQAELERIQQNASGLALESIDLCMVEIVEVATRQGSCTDGPISIEKLSDLNTKKSKMNNAVTSNDCLLLALASHFMPDKKLKNAEQHLRDFAIKNFNIDGLQFPSTMRDLERFERQNGHLAKEGSKIFINLFSLERNEDSVARKRGRYRINIIKCPRKQELHKEKDIVNLLLLKIRPVEPLKVMAHGAEAKFHKSQLHFCNIANLGGTDQNNAFHLMMLCPGPPGIGEFH